MFEVLNEILLERGHNLTIFTAREKKYENGTYTQHVFKQTMEIMQNDVNMMIHKEKFNPFQVIVQTLIAQHKVSRKLFNQSEIEKLFTEKENFNLDLMIVECGICPYFFLADLYDIPIISLQASDPFGFLQPFFVSEFIPSGSIGKSLLYILVEITHELHDRISSTWIASKYLKNPDWNKSINKLALLLTNCNENFGQIHPQASNIVNIGFLHVKPPKELEESELKIFIESSKNDVILMAFGSSNNMQAMTKETKRKFFNVFAQIKFSVILKHENEEELEVPSNVYLSNWLPLADVLAHPKVKIFITHGGLNSAYEAIDREVPMIVFPLSCDQPANAERMAANGIAIKFDLNKFTENQLLDAIHEISTNSSYKENLKNLKRLIYDQPMSNRELAIWHIERVLRLGKLSYADYPGKNLPFWKKYFEFVFVFWIFATLLIVKLIKKIIR